MINTTKKIVHNLSILKLHVKTKKKIFILTPTKNVFDNLPFHFISPQKLTFFVFLLIYDEIFPRYSCASGKHINTGKSIFFYL